MNMIIGGIALAVAVIALCECCYALGVREGVKRGHKEVLLFLSNKKAADSDKKETSGHL